MSSSASAAAAVVVVAKNNVIAMATVDAAAIAFESCWLLMATSGVSEC